MIFRNLVFVICCFLTCSFWGQETIAKLYFRDGDTIEGLAKIVKNQVKFKISEDAKSDLWDYLDISGLELSDGAYNIHYDYVEVRKSKEPKLLELVESGDVYLYTKTKKKGQTKDLNKIIGKDGTVTIGADTFSKLNFKGEDVYEYYLKRKLDFEAVCINCGVFGVSDTWKNRTSRFFGDCDTLIQKISKSEYRVDDMVEIIEFYNDSCNE